MSDPFLTQSDATLPTGYKVGEYVIEGILGAGTFGTVYRGIQPLIGKQVAVKVLSRKYSADPHVVSRFIAEARAVNQIRHKNIIDIFSFGQLEDGRHYHVMELLEGEPLDVYVKRKGGRLDVPVLLPILRGLARALDAAHAAGIAHRDLKPANVFLAKDEDGQPFPKLLDFGIAKLLTDEVPRQHHTATGAAVGTPDYMSPEQCEGPDVDHRTDIYAYGVMTFKLLVGQLPFTGKNVVEVLMKHMTHEPPRPSEMVEDVPEFFDGPILAMLAKAKEDRPQNLLVAVEALEAAAVKAGYEVLTTQSGSLNPLIRSGPHSVSDTGASAFAATIAGSGGLRSTGASGGSKPKWGLIVGGALVLLLPAVFFWSQRSNQIEAAPSGTPPPAPLPAVPKPHSPPMVKIWFAGAPAKTAITGPGGLHLGMAPGPIELPRGDQLTATFTAEGYEPLDSPIYAVASGTVTVSLKKLAPEPAKVSAKPRVKRPPKKKTGSKPKSKPKPKSKTKEKDQDALEVPSW